VIGADFCPVYFPLVLQIAASSVAAGIGLLPVLRGTARALGRGDLAQRAVDVERACYGTFDKTGLLVRIRD
jgi:hypothetical protein